MAADDTRLDRAMQDQIRASQQLSDAMKTLGSKAIDVLTENLKKAAKQAGVLTDEQLAVIKSSRDLSNALEIQEERVIALNKVARERFKKEIETMRKSETFNKLNKKIQDQIIADADKRHLQELREINDLEENHDALSKQTAKLIGSADSLDKFTSAGSRGMKALKGWAANTFTASNAIATLKDAANQAIGELNKATAVGLQDSLLSINRGAMHLNMSFDEFSGVIAKNRDSIRQLGGGIKGVQNFTAKLYEAGKGLEFMGREGNFATAKFIESMKTMGTTVNSKNFNKSMVGMQKHFTQFASLYGDSYDTYSDLIEAQYKSETLQTRLNGLDAAGRDALQEEIIQRTENNKNLGLSNEQIKEFNDKVSELYDPHKANLAEKVKGAEVSKSYLQQLAADSGDEALKAALPKLMEYLDYTKGATDDQIKAAQATMGKEFLAVGSAQASLTQKQAKVAGTMEHPGDIMAAGAMQIPENLMRLMGGGTAENVATRGTAIYQAQAQGRNLTSGQIAQGKAEAADQVAGNVDMYVKSLKIARDIQQNYNAIMENSITKGLKGMVEGLGAVILNLGKFKDILGSIVSKGGASAGGIGSMLEGFFGGAAAKAIPSGVAAGGTSLVSKIASKALPFARGATGLGLLLHSENLGAPAGQPGSDQWTPEEMAAMDKAPNVLDANLKGSTTDAHKASTAGLGQSDNLLDETRKQTSLLTTIAQNTAIAYKAGVDKRMLKSSPSVVANNIQ